MSVCVGGGMGWWLASSSSLPWFYGPKVIDRLPELPISEECLIYLQLTSLVYIFIDKIYVSMYVFILINAIEFFISY